MIKKVILNMLKVRNYKIDDEDYFINTQEEEYVFENNVCGNSNPNIFVFFPQTNTKVGVFTIRQYIKRMQDSDITSSIIVVKDAITAFAKQVFIEAKPLHFECFKENELLFDKLTHVLVPKHELLSIEEKSELLKIYKIKEGQLPKILSCDPIAKYFGARKGEVFKITRPSESSGEYIYYRIVV